MDVGLEEPTAFPRTLQRRGRVQTPVRVLEFWKVPALSLTWLLLCPGPARARAVSSHVQKGSHREEDGHASHLTDEDVEIC